MWYDDVGIDVLVGKTIEKITESDDELKFYCADGTSYIMYHEQDCCENVSIEDICGDLNDLVGATIISAEAVSQNDDDATESGTWTFYKIDSTKGGVTIRWHGLSNGYYSERVSFCQM